MIQWETEAYDNEWQWDWECRGWGGNDRVWALNSASVSALESARYRMTFVLRVVARRALRPCEAEEKAYI